MLVKELLSENLGKPLKLFNIGYPDIEDSDKKEQAFNAAWEMISANCKEILKIYKQSGKLLYRGVKGISRSPMIASKVRDDRKPGYTDKRIHTIVNDVLMDLGAKAHRGNSIFCTTRPNVADTWGDVFVVFPKDGFDVTYFEKMRDDYMWDAISGVEAKADYKMTELSKNHFGPEHKEYLKVAFEKLFKQKGLSTSKSNMSKAMNTTSEFLIHVDSYVGLDADLFKNMVKQRLK